MPIIAIGAAIALVAGGVGFAYAEYRTAEGTAAAAEAIGKAAGFAIIAGTAIYLLSSRKK